MPRSNRLLRAAVPALLIAALAGCTAAPEVSPTPEPTATATVPPASGDGVLRIGTLLPTTGGTAVLGPAMVAAVDIAVREINEAGGVNGAPIEVLHRDSGDAGEQRVEAAFGELVERGVDVVVGPSSSVLVERVLPLVVEAGVAVITPGASYPELTSLDDDGLLARTMPSAGLQGVALSQLILQERERPEVVLVHAGDGTGAAIDERLSHALEAEDGTLAASLEFEPEGDPAALVDRIAEQEPSDVVLATRGDQLERTAALAQALIADGFDAERLWFTDENLADYGPLVEGGALEGAHGIQIGAQPDDAFLQRLRQSDPAVLGTALALETYDAVVMAALAAVLAGDDGGASVAALLADASGGGPAVCTSFGACSAALADGQDIDYDGLSGPLDLDASGDPRRGTFGVHVYDAAGAPQRTEQIVPALVSAG
jgi:branched-chain amino acid transport system substrate-binding protein